jgi:hypothetical protein
MARRRILAALALLLASLVGHGEAAQSLEPLEVDWEQVFRLDWRVSESDGRPLIFGKIYNVSFYATNRIQLLVDRLDASGGTVAQQVAWLGFGLKPGDSAFFDVPVGDRAVAYRVRVFAFNRKLGTIQD